jgi:hypothetical protein
VPVRGVLRKIAPRKDADGWAVEPHNRENTGPDKGNNVLAR